jgi:hypothetical protein
MLKISAITANLTGIARYLQTTRIGSQRNKQQGTSASDDFLHT